MNCPYVIHRNSIKNEQQREVVGIGPGRLFFFVTKSWRLKKTSKSADNDDKLHLSKCKSETSPPNPESTCSSAWKRSVGKEGGWVPHRAVSASWYRLRHESPTNTTRGTLSQIQSKPAGPPKDSHRSQQAHQIQHHASQQDHQLDQEESGIEVMDLRDSEVLHQYKL